MTNTPIALTAYFDKEANIKPIRFKMDTEHGEQIAIVESSILKDNNKIRVEFICDIIVDNIRYKCEIWYFKNSLNWVLHSLK